MPEAINHNKRIAKNTIMLYVRMLVSMCIAFYTTRVVLAVLGVTDYGISNVVGGVASMFTFLNSSLSGATSRFLTVSLGEGNKEKIKQTFAASFTVHLYLALIILLLCETIGLWMVNNKLDIPEESKFAAQVLYQLSIFTTIANITQVPYSAVLIAHEKMDAYAYFSIADVVLKLAAVYLLQVLPFNKLITYGVLYFIIRIFIIGLNRLYAIKKFEECSTSFSKDKKLIIPMLSFSGWDLFGNMSIMVRTQGIDILQNIFFGPVINAASGISGQVMSIVTGFSSNFIMAVRPRIMKLYTQNKIEELQHLAERGSRMAFYLLFFISLPCFIELPIVLNLWLEDVPEYTVAFVRLAILFNLTIIMFFPLSAVIHATGKMKRISFINGATYIAVLPITYIVYKTTKSTPLLPYMLNIVLGLVGGLLSLQTVKLYVTDFNWFKYLKNAVGRGVITALLSLIIPIIIYFQLEPGWANFFIVCTTCVISSSVCILFIGINNHERHKIVHLLASKLHLSK